MRVLKLQEQPRPRVMLLTVEDAGLVCELDTFQVNRSLFPRLLSYKFRSFIDQRKTPKPKPQIVCIRHIPPRVACTFHIIHFNFYDLPLNSYFPYF